MRDFCQQLSSRQKAWSVGAIAVMVVIVAAGVLLEPNRRPLDDNGFSPAMSIKHIAPKLDVTGQALARELGLPLDVPKNKPLASLGVSEDELDHATRHVLSHKPTMLKYYVFVALVLFALVYLTQVGRPDATYVNDRRAWYPRAPYVAALVVAVVVCGFVLGKSPNPMEGAVKFFKSLVGLYPSVLAKALGFAFFVGLGVIGNKLVCGWACPFGAIQELIYTLAAVRRFKRWKLPFCLSNTIRGTLFVIMLLFLFGIVGGRTGVVIYHALNPFNLFDLEFDEWLVPMTIVLSVLLSLFVYRPFCYLICPFGLLSWMVERLSLARVRINLAKCRQCGACIAACPSDAAKGIIEGKLLPADCMSCARCLNVCPHDLIRYGVTADFPETMSDPRHRLGNGQEHVKPMIDAVRSSRSSCGGSPKEARCQ